MKKVFKNCISYKEGGYTLDVKISNKGKKLLQKASEDEKKEYVNVLVVELITISAQQNDKDFDVTLICDEAALDDLSIDSLDVVQIEDCLEKLFSIKQESLKLEKTDAVSVVVEKVLKNIN